MANWQFESKAGEVDLHMLARTITDEQMAYFLDDYMNGRGGAGKGYLIGRLMTETHRALQALTIEFCIGILRGMTKHCLGTDPRNEWEIETARKMLGVIE